MRRGYAIGAGLVILAALAAAVAWAPVVAAQQDASARQERQNVVVTVDGRSAQPQGTTWSAQSGNVFALGGPRLGVSIRDVEAADASKMKLTGLAGVVVEDVTKDSAAAKAGLKAGDVIVQFDGEAIRSTRQFTRLVNESATGRAVKIGVMRDGKRIEVEATPTMAEGPSVGITINRDDIQREVERSLAQAERGLAQAGRNRAQAERNLSQAEPLLRQFRVERAPGGPGGAAPRLPSDRLFSFEGPMSEALAKRLEGSLGAVLANRGRLGVTVQELTPELAAFFGVKDGVLVSTVRADSPASKAGIKAGDVITMVNEKPVADASALVDQLRDKDGDVTIGLSRDKKAMSVKATLEKAAPSKPRIVVRRVPA